MTLNAVSGYALASTNVGDPIRLAGFPLRQRAHIRALFSNWADENRALLPFIPQGCAKPT